MYDAFLSHNSADKLEIDHICRELTQRGVKCWFDAGDLRAGAEWMSRLEAGLAESKCCVVFYGPSGIGPWHEMERQLASLMAADAWREGRKFGIIPVRLSDAPDWRQLALPPFLRLYASVEFSEPQDDSAIERLALAISEEAAPPDFMARGSTESPYKGMKPYVEEDAPKYFGRNNYILHLCDFLQSVREPRFISIIGASGSGKSSLMHAGVLARLRAGRFRRETKDWVYAKVRTGGSAWGDLRATILGLPGFDRQAGFVPSRPECWLHEITLAALGSLPGSKRLIIMIDQFEELLTLRPQGEGENDQRVRDYDERTWKPFLKNISYAVSQVGGRVSVVLTVRNDFLLIFASDPIIGPLLDETKHRCLLLPLTEPEVRSVVERPAASAGAKLDDALAERLVQDYLLDPSGALPFLQEALLRIWRTGGRAQLNYADYRKHGGLAGAVNAQAEDVLNHFRKLDPKYERLFRQIFVHLVRIADDGGLDTKRRRPLSELPGGAEAKKLAVTLTMQEYRLLVIDQESAGDSESAEDRVEIAHESLIRGWKQLDSWLTDKALRPLRIRLRRLEALARSRQPGTPGGARAGLLAGGDLRDARLVNRELADEVPELVQNFVTESKQAAKFAFLKRAAVLFVSIVGIGMAFRLLTPLNPGTRNATLRNELNRLIAPFNAAEVVVVTGEILQNDKTDPQIWRWRAQAFLELKDEASFKNTMDAWQRNTPGDSPQRELLLGDAAIQNKQNEVAIRRLESYLKYPQISREDRSMAYSKLVTAYLQTGNSNKAIEVSRNWIEAADSPAARASLVESYRNSQDWELYEQAILDLRSSYPASMEATNIRPLQGVDEMFSLASLANNEPYDEKVWHDYIVALTSAGEIQAALDVCQATFDRLGNQHFDLKMELAHLHWQLGRAIPPDLGIVPSAQWSKSDLPKFKERYEAMQQNLRVYREAAERLSKTRQAGDYYTRGTALARLSQHAMAIRDFESALSIDPAFMQASQARADSAAKLKTPTSIQKDSSE